MQLGGVFSFFSKDDVDYFWKRADGWPKKGTNPYFQKICWALKTNVMEKK